LRDIHTKPIPIVRFSMLLQYHSCPTPIWNILSHLRLALSINTTKELYTVASAIPLPIRLNWDDHSTIAVLGADNMSYVTHKKQVRLENGSANTYLTFQS
jgi:hypothetical protein